MSTYDTRITPPLVTLNPARPPEAAYARFLAVNRLATHEQRCAVQAASGMGEPFVSAAGILGVMVIWRSFYAAFLDWSAFASFDWDSAQRELEAQRFVETLRVVTVIALTGVVLALGSSYIIHMPR